MSFAERLEKDYKSMLDADFSNSEDLFRLIKEKIEITWTLKEIEAALKWLIQFKVSWTVRPKVKEISEPLLNAFPIPEDSNLEEFSSSFIKEIKEIENKIYPIRRQLDAIDEEFIFNPKTSPDSANFNKYEHIGRILLGEERFQILSDPSYPATLCEISKLASKIYTNVKETDTYIPPSMIICTPPGTGKTQIPFALDIPLLYFTHVYQPYDINSHFRRLIE